MYPVQFFRELARQPLFRNDGTNGLVIDVAPGSFVIHRNITANTCNVQFAKTIRMNRSTPIIAVTPESIHMAPHVAVTLVPTACEYDPKICLSTQHTNTPIDEIYGTEMTGKLNNENTHAYGAEVLLPDYAKTYFVHGMTTRINDKPRCMRKPMRMNLTVQQDNFAFDDKPVLISDDTDDSRVIDDRNNDAFGNFVPPNDNIGSSGSHNIMFTRCIPTGVKNTAATAAIVTAAASAADANADAVADETIAETVKGVVESTNMIFGRNDSGGEQYTGAIPKRPQPINECSGSSSSDDFTSCPKKFRSNISQYDPAESLPMPESVPAQDTYTEADTTTPLSLTGKEAIEAMRFINASEEYHSIPTQIVTDE